ncbi:SsrA-binding protein [Candidatus Saccharibacteria bacterium]|nr:SsrA-binding protein [Candidatus Saccharibacteria bacterium]
MKKKKTGVKPVINRRARYDYELSDEIECGMVLTGQQVRLIRDHHAQLKGTYVTVRNNELWLVNLTLGSESATDIKLLATKKQITHLLQAKVDGKTIVPTQLYPERRYIKLKIAIGKGKKKYDKRQTIKARDISREMH